MYDEKEYLELKQKFEKAKEEKKKAQEEKKKARELAKKEALKYVIEADKILNVLSTKYNLAESSLICKKLSSAIKKKNTETTKKTKK